MARWIWRGMFGNGWLIGMIELIIKIFRICQLSIRLSAPHQGNLQFYEAVLGLTRMSAFDLQTVFGVHHLIRLTSMVFVAPVLLNPVLLLLTNLTLATP